MKITKITEKNKKEFEGFFPGPSLRSSLPLIRIGVTDDDGAAAGALCATVFEFCTEIVSVFVIPERRRQGYGSAMLDTLRELLSGSGSDTLTATFLEDDASTAFFSSLGFDLFPSRMQYSFSLGQLLRSPLFKRYISGGKIKPSPVISDIEASYHKQIDTRVQNHYYDPEWSTAHFESGRLKSMLLATCSNESISIVWMESESDNPRDLMQDMSGLLKITLERFGLNRNVTFRMIFSDEKLANNMAALLGGAHHLNRDGRFLLCLCHPEAFRVKPANRAEPSQAPVNI